MVDGAVCCESLSAIEFPDHQGKCREFGDSRAQIHLFGHKKIARLLRFFREFPSNRNRELNEAIREVKVPVPFPNRVLTPCIPVLYGPGDSNDFSRAYAFCAYVAVNRGAQEDQRGPSAAVLVVHGFRSGL